MLEAQLDVNDSFLECLDSEYLDPDLAIRKPSRGKIRFRNFRNTSGILRYYMCDHLVSLLTMS